MQVRAVLGLAVAVVALGLAGCSASPKASFPGSFAERPVLGALPPDLPQNPEPCVSYCREEVPATYRMVPKLCQVDCAKTVNIEETVYEMRAREVEVTPRCTKTYEACGERCQQELVQVKPGAKEILVLCIRPAVCVLSKNFQQSRLIVHIVLQ